MQVLAVVGVRGRTSGMLSTGQLCPQDPGAVGDGLEGSPGEV